MQIGDADYAEKIFVQGCISLRPKQNMRKLLIILGVPIDDLTLPAALDQIDEFVEIGRATGTSHQIATINADFVTKALDDPELRLILQEADMATADGMPLVWGARLLGVPLEGRVTGADLVPALAERAAQKGYSMYMLGAAPGIAQRAADILCERYPGLKIAGVYSPPQQRFGNGRECGAARPRRQARYFVGRVWKSETRKMDQHVCASNSRAGDDWRGRYARFHRGRDQTRTGMDAAHRFGMVVSVDAGTAPFVETVRR